jgi:hypothetical protein
VAAVALSVVAALLVVAAVVVVARDDDGGGGDPPTVAPADLDIAELEGALLTAADVGNGYTDSFDDGGDDDELNLDAIDASPECLEAISRFQGSDVGDESIDAGFESGDLTEVNHEIGLIREGELGIAEFQAALDACETMAFDDGETEGEIRVQSELVDGLGEGALAITMQLEGTADGVGVSAEIYGIYWSRGGVGSSVDMVVIYSSVLGGTQDGDPDPDLVRQLADTADRKLDGVLAG